MDGVQKSVTACGKGIRAACGGSRQAGSAAHRATGHDTEGKAPKWDSGFVLSGHLMLGCSIKDPLNSQGPVKPGDVT